MNLSISDLIYSFYLTGNFRNLEHILKLKPDQFEDEIYKHFYVPYHMELNQKMGTGFDIGFEQEEIDQIFTDWALFFNKTGDSRFLKNRDVTQEQIDKYKLGSTHGLEQKNQIQPFIKKLLSNYSLKLVNLVTNFHLDLLHTNEQYYDDPHASTIPCFDLNNMCRGIVYRVHAYKPKEENIRNLYKFHVSHAPSYLFNQHVISNYDQLFLVEGVFDALSMIRLGYENVVSPSHGKLSKFQVDKLKNKHIIQITDPDLGGLSSLEYVYSNYHNQFESARYYQTHEQDIDDLIRTDPNKAKSFLKNIL